MFQSVKRETIFSVHHIQVWCALNESHHRPQANSSSTTTAPRLNTLRYGRTTPPRISWPMYACSCRSSTAAGTRCPAWRMCSAWSGSCGTASRRCIRCRAIITLTFCSPPRRPKWSFSALFNRPGSWTWHWRRFKATENSWLRVGLRRNEETGISSTKRGLTTLALYLNILRSH